MHPRRFLIPPGTPLQEGRELVLEGREAKHLGRVLRARAGTRVELADGAGLLVQAEVTGRRSGRIRLRVLQVERGQDDRLPLEVLVGILKGEKMDLVIQKVSEIGARSIQPVITEHTVPRLDRHQERKKVKRWRETARQALKQCRATTATLVHGVSTLEEALDERRCSAGIVLDAAHGARNLVEVLHDPGILPPGKDGAIRILIGPEGGLSRGELDLCLRRGLVPASLGKRVLRAETAAIGATLVTALFLEGGA